MAVRHDRRVGRQRRRITRSEVQVQPCEGNQAFARLLLRSADERTTQRTSAYSAHAAHHGAFHRLSAPGRPADGLHQPEPAQRHLEVCRPSKLCALVPRRGLLAVAVSISDPGHRGGRAAVCAGPGSGLGHEPKTARNGPFQERHHGQLGHRFARKRPFSPAK